MRKEIMISSLLLLVIFIVNFITMPGQICVGDGVAVLLNTIHLVNDGEIDMPADIANKCQEPGQYYYHNKVNDKWYPKYGIMNTFMYLPPLLVEKIFNGTATGRLLSLNLYYILLSLVIGLFLFKIAGFYTDIYTIRIAFVLTSFYATFMWNYLRAQSLDIFQLLFFLICYYYLLSYKRALGESGGAGHKVAYTYLLYAMVSVLCLCLLKLVFVLVLFPIAVFILLYPYDPSKRFAANISWKLRHKIKSYLAFLVIPAFVILAAVMFVNAYKFGSPFDTGYRQWAREQDLFSGNIINGIRGFFFDIQYGIFDNFPILLLSFLGVKRFYKKNPVETILCYSIFFLFLIVYSKFHNWRGAWGYGPRYLLFILPVISLPFIETLKIVNENIRRFWARACLLIIMFMLLFSARQQIYVNSLDFFAYYRMEETFMMIYYNKSYPILRATFAKIEDYLKTNYFGNINRDIMEYKSGGKELYCITLLRPFFSSEFIDERMEFLDRNVKFNYYWFARER